jgi:hypothetical protein
MVAEVLNEGRQARSPRLTQRRTVRHVLDTDIDGAIQRDAIPGQRARIILLRRGRRRRRSRRRRRLAQLIDLLLHLPHLIFELLNVLCVVRKDDTRRDADGGAGPHGSQDRLAQLKLMHCVHSRGFRLLDLIDVLLRQYDSGFCR